MPPKENLFGTIQKSGKNINFPNEVSKFLTSHFRETFWTIVEAKEREEEKPQQKQYVHLLRLGT